MPPGCSLSLYLPCRRFVPPPGVPLCLPPRRFPVCRPPAVGVPPGRWGHASTARPPWPSPAGCSPSSMPGINRTPMCLPLSLSTVGRRGEPPGALRAPVLPGRHEGCYGRRCCWQRRRPPKRSIGRSPSSLDRSAPFSWQLDSSPRRGGGLRAVGAVAPRNPAGPGPADEPAVAPWSFSLLSHYRTVEKYSL